MSEIFTLTKILMKKKSTDNKNKRSFGKILLYVLVYGYLIAVISTVSFQLLSSCKNFGVSLRIILNITFLDMFVLGILQSVISSINILYFSKDIEFLLPLPIKSYKIVAAKINCLVITQYILEFLIFAPFLIICGIVYSFTFMYYIYVALILLLFPITPVIISTLLVTVLMKFTNVIKNKNVLQYAIVGILFILIFGVQFLSTSYMASGNEEQAYAILNKNQEKIERITKICIVADQSKQMLLNYNNNYALIIAILFILSTFVFGGLGTLWISSMYLKYVLEAKNSHLKARKQKEAQIISSDIKKSYFGKELKMMMRNPVFFMQCVMPAIVLPIVILVPTYFSFNAQEAMEVIDMISHYIYTPIGIGCVLNLLILLFMFNTCSVTSISRDADGAIFMKYIPISLEKQVHFKSLFGIILNVVTMIILFIGIKLLVPSINLVLILMTFIIAYLINVINNYIAVIIDLKNPKTKWSNEYQVVKQNSNIAIQFLVFTIEMILYSLFSALFKSLVQYLMIMFISNILIIMIIRNYIKENRIKLFSKIN